ncbi:MAG: putative transposase [Glaciecola sp.]|jgi:putative transposase
MKRLGLVVKPRIAYKVTTKRKHSDAVADNLLNMNLTHQTQIKSGPVTFRI